MTKLESVPVVTPLQLEPGKVYRIGDPKAPGGCRYYGVCFACLKLVRLDKPIVGALHYCDSDAVTTYASLQDKITNRYASLLDRPRLSSGWRGFSER